MQVLDLFVLLFGICFAAFTHKNHFNIPIPTKPYHFPELETEKTLRMNNNYRSKNYVVANSNEMQTRRAEHNAYKCRKT